nr:FMN-binding split barrel [Tanacetum cinerariifolium]
MKSGCWRHGVNGTLPSASRVTRNGNISFNIQRLAFEEGHGVETLVEAKAALWNLIHRGGGLKLEHKL